MTGVQSKARRWPDLLIGLLVLLLLAGFAVLLAGQRAPRVQVAQAPAPATVTTTPPPVIPSAPGTALGAENTDAPAVTSPSAPAASEEQDDEPQPTEAAPKTDTTPAATEPAAPAPQATGPKTNTSSTPTDRGSTSTATGRAPAATAPTPRGEVPVVPTEPIPAAPAAPPAPQVTVPSAPPASAATGPASRVTSPSPTATTTPAPSPSPSASATTPASTVPPRAGRAVATSEQRTPLRSDYRISLGTFGSTGAAQSSAQGVRALGYTVYPIDLGDQVVAQVGPFADEATARQALADIQRVYPRALLYPPRNRSLTGGSASGAASTRETSTGESTVTPATPTQTQNTSDTPSEVQAPEAPPAAPPAAAATPTTPPATAPSGPVYLQVGAFDRVESAQRLVGLLRDQGYAPTVNAPDSGKVTVLIGPFSGEAVTEAEQKLDSGGFDHFRVR